MFNSLEEMCTEDNKICLRRRLQHVRGNVKKAAKTSPENSDTARLRKPKMLEYFDKFLISSNWFPNDLEFDVFWRSVLGRCKANRKKTDWDEPEMAKYLEKNILDCSGPYNRASWICGLGAVPFGFTTLTPNCIEQNNRLLKDLLKPGYQKCNAAEIMIQICEVLSGRIAGGHYNKIINKVKEEWPALKRWPSRRNSVRYEVFDLENEIQNP